MTKVILFDFGGTLDTNGIHWSEKFWQVYEKLKVPVSKKQYEEAYVFSENKILGMIKPNHGFMNILEHQVMFQLLHMVDKKLIPDNERLDLTHKISRMCYRDVLENILMATEILEQLKNKYHLGVVSNFYGNLKSILEELSIIKYFDVIIDSELVSVKKPDPKIFQIAIDRINVSASETLVVGDSYDRDIQPAKKIGCTTMWLDGISWTRPSITTDADYTIKSLNEIISWL